MLTKGSLSVVGSRFSLVYKIIIYILLCMLIFGVVGYAALAQALSPLSAEFKELALVQTFVNYVKSIFRGVDNVGENTIEQSGVFQELLNKIVEAKNILADNLSTVWAAIAVLVLLMIVFGILYSAMFYPTVKVLSEFMSSNSKFGFTSCYVASAKRSFSFSTVSTCVSFVCYTAGFLASFGVAYLISKWNVFFGFMTFYLACGVIVSLKHATFIGWLPAYVVDNLSIKESLKVNFQIAGKGKFVTNFLIFFTYYLIFSAITVVLAFVTLLTAVPFFIGFILVYTQAFRLVNYYHYRGYKYYKDDQTVVDPKKRYGNAVLENPVQDPNDGDLTENSLEKAGDADGLSNEKGEDINKMSTVEKLEGTPFLKEKQNIEKK